MSRVALALVVVLLLASVGGAFATTAVTIGDTVWVNYNGDSIKDADEPGIPGATLTLWLLNGTTWENVGTTTTDANGLYKFAGLVPGYDWKVSVALPAGYAGYTQNYDRDGVLDGQSNGVVSVTTLTYDFGYVPLSSIGDRVWNDVDNSGGADTLSEPGINGVRVVLYDASGAYLRETTTAAGTINGVAVDGVYLFDKLVAGTYTVLVDVSTIPSGMNQTYDLDGVLDSETTVPLAWNENIRTVDFSYYKPTTTDGGWATFTQGGWGAKPAGNNPGMLLHTNWDTVYGAAGLTVGSGEYTITFTSAWAVTNFLPSGGTPRPLGRDYVDPKGKTTAGVLAGQVVAMKLNVDFSANGFTAPGLGALKIQSGAYAGWTVSQLLGLAQAVLGGDTSGLLGSVADLNSACTAVNEAFNDGTVNGFLAK
ncbi:MSCRAMM family adhesin SdrC [bacterium]|nr:MSCRAMM family adhesin SdrC [bacterium]